MKGFLCTANSEIGVLTSREANAASKAHRVMNKPSLWEPMLRSRKGPTYLASILSLYTQQVSDLPTQPMMLMSHGLGQPRLIQKVCAGV